MNNEIRETLQLLTRFCHKARCRRGTSQYTAGTVWRDLKPRLSKDQAEQLHDAWIHYRDVHGSYVTQLDNAYHRVREELLRRAGRRGTQVAA